MPRGDGSSVEWRRFSVELAVLAVISFGVEWLIAGPAGAGSFHPHPYWLFVLPIAAVRGTAPGLLSACVASFVFLGRHPQFEQGLPLSDLSVFREPLLFFVVSYVAGAGRDVLARGNRNLQRTVNDTEALLRRAQDERDQLAARLRALEDNTGAGDHATHSFHGQGDRDRLFEIALGLVEEHCGAPASVLFVKDDGTVELCAWTHRPGIDQAARFALLQDSAVVGRARGKGVTVAAGPADSADDPTCVAPLFDERGFMRALLCLEGTSSEPLGADSVQSFLGVAEWTSAGFARLQSGAEPLDRETAPEFKEPTHRRLGTPEDLDERLHTEFERFVRHDVPVSVIAIQATRWVDTTPTGIEELDRHVLDAVASGLRVTDSLFRFGWPGCYVLVLMGTSQAAGELVQERLRSRLAESTSDAFGPLEFCVAAPSEETPDCNDLIEHVADWFREAAQVTLGCRVSVLCGGARRIGDRESCFQRLELEMHMALRTGGELSIVELSTDRPTDCDPLALRDELDAVARTSLRRSDGVFQLDPDRLLLVLPHTAADEAQIVATRTEDRLRKRLRGTPLGRIRCTARSIEKTSGSPRALVCELMGAEDSIGASAAA